MTLTQFQIVSTLAVASLPAMVMTAIYLAEGVVRLWESFGNSNSAPDRSTLVGKELSRFTPLNSANREPVTPKSKQADAKTQQVPTEQLSS